MRKAPFTLSVRATGATCSTPSIKRTMSSFHSHILLSFLLLCLNFNEALSQEKKPAPSLRTKVWGAEWLDFFDEPREVHGELRLKKLDGSEYVVPKSPGKPLLIVEVDPDIPWWTETATLQLLLFDKPLPETATLPKPETLLRYIELYNMFSEKGVTFVPVWTQRLNAGEQTRDAAAKKYAAERKFPGDLYIGKGLELDRYCGLEIEQENKVYYISKYLKSMKGTWGSDVCLIRGDGKIVYRNKGSLDSNVLRLLIERLLDPEFDRDVRRNFVETRTWDQAEVTEKGLLYKDDFESYKSSFDFKTNNRWGFEYNYQAFLDLRGDLTPEAGRNGSTALYSNTRWRDLHDIKPDYYSDRQNHYYAVPSLFFPAPLVDGYLKFYFRRGPEDELKEHRTLSRISRLKGTESGFGITFFTSHYDMIQSFEPIKPFKGNGQLMLHEVYAGKVTAWPKKGKEADPSVEYFLHPSRRYKPTDQVCGNEWHEVTVRCSPGKMAEGFIDGDSIGELQSSTLTSVYFSCDTFRPGFYIDDLELFYKGADEATLQKHREAPWPRQYELNKTMVPDDQIEMVKIPGGSFTQGDELQGTLCLLYAIGRPVRKVTLSPFLMAKYPVTIGQYHRVYKWAIKNGYDFVAGLHDGSKKHWDIEIVARDHSMDPQHPVRHTTPFNQFKWMNALSEMEGRTPCYYTDETHKTVYRTGEIDLESTYVRWDVDGYRAPTIAEWQYAFLGNSGHPYRWWGDIVHHHPEVYGHMGMPYKNFPRVGSVPANPFGIVDMGFWYECSWDVSAPWPPGDAHNPKGGTVEDGQETQDYVERMAVQIFPREIKRGGKVDASKTKACGRALPGCFGFEGGGGYGSAHGHYAFKRADHTPSYHTGDGTFRLAMSDTGHPGGSYSNGKPALIKNPVPPRVHEVVVEEGEVRGDFISLRKIPAGKYHRGGKRKKPMLLSGIYMDNTPMEKVKLDEYWIGKTEVTFGQYKEVHDWAVKNGYTFSQDQNWTKRYLMKGENHPNPYFTRVNPEIEYTGKPTDLQPVNHVCWYDAVKWCNALSEKEGRKPAYYTNAQKDTIYRKGELDLAPECVDWKGTGYRLPTEAEWEAACRGGTDTKYFCGDQLDDRYLWHQRNLPATRSQTTRCYWEVGKKKPNPYGLYDITGNIFEWSFDWLGPYDTSSLDNPKGCSKELSIKAHEAIVAEREEKIGPSHIIWDADPAVGQVTDPEVMKKMRKLRNKQQSEPWPGDLEFCRAKRVLRGGMNWGSAKRFGSDPLWTRHDQGFRVALSKFE